MASAATTERSSISLRSTMLWVGSVAALWLVAATIRNGTTLHLGPLLVPLIPLVIARKEDFAVRATALASGVGLAVIGVLWATGNLNGPALDPFSSAVAESLAFLMAGTAIGVVGIVASRNV